MSISVNTSNNPQVEWENSVWFSDVDDTLIDTAGTTLSASESIAEVFSQHFDHGKAVEVREKFNSLFELMMAGYRVKEDADWNSIAGGKAAFSEMIDYLTDCQVQVRRDYGHIKKWSREIFIKRAAELAGLTVGPEIVNDAANSYWSFLNSHVQIFPDALNISKAIALHDRPLFLVTSSDGRLKMRQDGQFIYDPQHSERLKRARIEKLRERGLEFLEISIGDPEDKPQMEFFQKAIQTAEQFLGAAVDMKKSIMLGDSYAGDLQTPKELLGFGLVVLRDDHVDAVEINDQRQITTNRLDIIDDFIIEK